MGSRDELWKVSWETFYDTFYYEVLFGELSKSWQRFDFVARLLVALTASGSAVAGWALWNDADYKLYWTLFAALASVISIVHATVNAPEKLKHYVKLSNDISEVKIEYETFRHELAIYPEFDIDKNFKRHQKLREKYQKVLSGYSPDFMASQKAQNYAQTLLNEKLGIEE